MAAIEPKLGIQVIYLPLVLVVGVLSGDLCLPFLCVSLCGSSHYCLINLGGKNWRATQIPVTML